MDKVDIVIIGAGVVGLAIARELSAKLQAEIVLLEKHPYFGAETSSRNSEVIHGGMYYPTNSLKARFCVRGNRQLYDICQKYRIPYRKTGKLIVASTAEELAKVEALPARQSEWCPQSSDVERKTDSGNRTGSKGEKCSIQSRNRLN